MIAIRGAMLVLAVVLAVAAFGGTAMKLQPSEQRLVVTAVTGVVTPLFWAGAGPTLATAALRVAAWSAAASCLAAAVLQAIGGGRQPVAEIATACAMLMLVVLLTLAAAAALDLRLRRKSGDAAVASETAGRTAALLLALVGGVPLWLGPVAEILARTRPWIVDAVVAISPLAHLAIAAGNDLLRDPWFYDHSNLARLAVSYPSLNLVLAVYVSILSALATALLAERYRRRRAVGADASRSGMADAP
jgi:hypothetical protein